MGMPSFHIFLYISPIHDIVKPSAINERVKPSAIKERCQDMTVMTTEEAASL